MTAHQPLTMHDVCEDLAGPADQPRIAVLGAGPAGVGAALYLAKSRKASVCVYEAADGVGGAAGGFDLAGVHCDLGSHRLHPAAEPHVMEEIKAAVGDDLFWRPRHGRIRLQERWIHFPLKPVDFALNARKSFVASAAIDSALKFLPKKASGGSSFASVLERGLGRTICHSFYFPYARKLWGVEPETLDATAARRRVSGSSARKIIAKVLRQLPGLKSPTAGGFYYPRRGFKQIVEGLRAASEQHGALYALNTKALEIHRGYRNGFRLLLEGPDGTDVQEADAIWSTIPISALVRAMRPAAPGAVLEAAASIRYRSMILIYLVLEQDQFTEYDAHYFPETAIPVSRLSEPKNYSASKEPEGITVLCLELPCNVRDEVWAMSDDALGHKSCSWLASAGLPVRSRVRTVATRRLSHAYPIYDRDFSGKLDTLEAWIESIGGIVTFGRQGLFAHDNTHHALAMAHAAAQCLRDGGSWDRAAWAQAREAFRQHVVED
ncbi:MAG: FAD-dependent oxidoreductase [Beijerinckiaceae bacterium]|nr:FAD-dependent oxidoreductase [Beijerinckiaceae bacterium]